MAARRELGPIVHNGKMEEVFETDQTNFVPVGRLLVPVILHNGAIS